MPETDLRTWRNGANGAGAARNGVSLGPGTRHGGGATLEEERAPIGRVGVRRGGGRAGLWGGVGAGGCAVGPGGQGA